MIYGDYRDDHPLSAIVHAVAAGEVDVAAVWGAIAGYFARKEQPPLVVTAIAGSPEARLPMTLRHFDRSAQNRQAAILAVGRRTPVARPAKRAPFPSHRFATPPDTIETVIVAIASALGARPSSRPSLLQEHPVADAIRRLRGLRRRRKSANSCSSSGAAAMSAPAA